MSESTSAYVQETSAWIGAASMLFILSCGQSEGAPHHTQERVASYAVPPKQVPLPAAGTFNFRWVIGECTSVVPGINDGWGPSPELACFQVDYNGPRTWIEIVAENWHKGQLDSTEVVYREAFGSDDRRKSGDTTTYFEGPPYSRPRQMYFLRVYQIVGCDNKNGLMSLIHFDAVEQGFWTGHQSMFHATAFDSHLMGAGGAVDSTPFAEGTKISESFWGPSDPLPDNESVVLWACRSGHRQSQLSLRFASE